MNIKTRPKKIFRIGLILNRKILTFFVIKFHYSRVLNMDTSLYAYSYIIERIVMKM
ncbi:MAG: hypothetical protein HN576_09545 [Bacteriovoracaceae bacterium]|nr:hypothetical protein [Bacteriovoracaceae bacterium]